MKDNININAINTNNTFLFPKKALSIKKRNTTLNKNKYSIEMNKTNTNTNNLFTSYMKNTKNKKSLLNFPSIYINPSDLSKTRTSYSYNISNNKTPKNKINIKHSCLFPTSINESLYKKNNIITELNYENVRGSKKFKEYQKKMEESSFLINEQGKLISNDIKNNPFMWKIEDLNKINHFEILFHKSILQNIQAAYEKTKKGFFKIDHTTRAKNVFGTGYVCENKNNIFEVSDMIERMNPISTLKFSKLLRTDYKEFLGYDKKKKKNKKKEDRLRKIAIKKYHRELFFENEFADKYNIKKNSGIKFIFDIDDNNENKKKKDDEEDNYNNNDININYDTN